jgi:hypothetical protein
MADKNLRINISVTGAEKTRAEIKKTTQGIGNMRLTTAGLRREIGKVRNAFLLWMFAIRPALKLIRHTTNALFEQEKAERKLRTALANVTTATAGGADKLIRYAAALQKTSVYGDEQIISAAGILATFQLNEDAIGHLLPRLLDMTTSYGNLESNALLLGKAFTGNASSLSEVGVQFDKTKLQAAQAKGAFAEFEFLTKSLDENYKKLAENLAETNFGVLAQMEHRIGTLSEKLGIALVPLRLWSSEVKLKLAVFALDAAEALQILGTTAQHVLGRNMAELPDALVAVQDQFYALREAIQGTTGEEEEFDWAMGRTNQQLLLRLQFMRTEAKFSEAVSVAYGLQHNAVTKLNKDGTVTVGIQKILHPLEEQKIRLDSQAIALRKQGAKLAKEGGVEATRNATAQIELGVKQLKLESQIALARHQHNAAFIGALGDVAGEVKDGAKTAARLAQISAVVDTYAAANKAYAQGGIFGFVSAATIVAAGLANVMKISNAIGDFGSAQFGMDQIVSKPTLILTGEQNKREHVQVTPLQSPNLAGPSSGGVVVNINAPLVDETVRDSIMPSIQKALRSNAA